MYNFYRPRKTKSMRNLFFLVVLAFVSCKQNDIPLTAQQIIDKAIIANGSDNVNDSELIFNFRQHKYKATRKQGKFILERITTKEIKITHDFLSNDGFKRKVNNEPVQVIDSMAFKYSNSINSVHYFSVLPYGLNDAAVHKKLLEDVDIHGESYYKVEIRFSEEGGGKDFEDVFVYWIGKKDFKMDYLAYSYLTDEGGMRFRESKNERVVNGIRFLDYNNYKAKNASTKLENLDKAFINNELIKLSEINLENVKVKLLD